MPVTNERVPIDDADDPRNARSCIIPVDSFLEPSQGDFCLLFFGTGQGTRDGPWKCMYVKYILVGQCVTCLVCLDGANCNLGKREWISFRSNGDSGRDYQLRDSQP